jgi:hypothetical protein
MGKNTFKNVFFPEGKFGGLNSTPLRKDLELNVEQPTPLYKDPAFDNALNTDI